MKRLVFTLFAALLATAAVQAQPKTVAITVTGGKEDVKNAIASVLVPAKIATSSGPIVTTAGGMVLPSQAASPRLLAEKTDSMKELSVLIPELKAGQTLDLTADFGSSIKPLSHFAWKEVDGLWELHLLSKDPRAVIRYMSPTFDPKLTQKGKETANPTTKPYHHLFAPDGKTLVTNSAEGQFPHHRGIYFGFNNVTYDGKKADVWHCRSGEYTAHEKVIEAVSGGALFGRHTLQIGWHGQDGAIFANEKRELAVYNLPGGNLIDFVSVLTTPLDKVRLDGDPQHAGFHFRANSAMEKNTKETYFIRPDGKGKAGEEKNWVPKGKAGPVNLLWNAMSFVLEGKRYTVVYLDHPDNPKEARQSERAYGRIGTYFEYDLTKEKPLKVKYRLWFQEGEPTVAECEALSNAFVSPPSAKLATR